jgi:hypothetical protein
MGEQNKFSSIADREVEILLKEYEALRTEINSHIASQTQITTLAIILLGGLTASVPLIVSIDSHQNLQLRFPFVYLVLSFLIVSLLFTSLLWAAMSHDVQMAYITQYIYRDIRSRAFLLLEGTTTSILNWDHYRIELLFSSPKNPRQLAVRLTVGVLNAAQYALMLVPGVVSLVAAGVVYINYASIPPRDVVSWFDFVLFIFDSFYLITIIPCALYVARAYKEGPSYLPFF